MPVPALGLLSGKRLRPSWISGFPDLEGGESATPFPYWLNEHPEERENIAAHTAVTASAYTWDRNGVEMRAIFASALDRRLGATP